MQTFTQKRNQSQKRVSSNLTRSETATLRPHHPNHPILQLHRAIGHQAAQRMLQINADQLEVALTGTASRRFGHDFSRVSVHPPAPGAIQTKLVINHPGDESEMFARYKKWQLREQSFDNPSTREGYSKTSPKEFYAEGYSVFHGGKEWNQARLLYYAPELYELLEAEAKQQGLGVPDRSKIEAALKEQNLQ